MICIISVNEYQKQRVVYSSLTRWLMQSNNKKHACTTGRIASVTSGAAFVFMLSDVTSLFVCICFCEDTSHPAHSILLQKTVTDK